MPLTKEKRGKKMSRSLGKAQKNESISQKRYWKTPENAEMCYKDEEHVK